MWTENRLPIGNPIGVEAGKRAPRKGEREFGGEREKNLVGI